MVENGKSADKPTGAPPESPSDGRGLPASDGPPAREGLSARLAAPPPARGGRASLWLLLFALTLAVAGVATQPLWWPPVSQHLVQALEPTGDPRIGGLEQRLQAIEILTRGRATDSAAIQDLEAERARSREELKALLGRLESTERTIATVRQMAMAAQATSTAAEATQSLQELSDRLARLESTGGKAADINKRLDALEKLETKAATGAQATVIAVSQVREAARGAAPFNKELEALKTVAGTDEQIAKLVASLSPYASRGVAKVATLQDRFPGVAARVARASRTRGGSGWFDQTLDRLSSLVSLRRIDQSTDPASPDAILAAAEAELKDGDLIEAVQALEALQGAPREAAEPWLKDARARIAVEQAVAALHVYAVSLLGPAKK